MNKLASESVGKVLGIVLMVIILAELFAFTTTLIYTFNFDLYLTLAQAEQAVNSFILISMYILYIIYFVWMYKVHVDMQFYNLNYPIKPSKSVWSFLIPFYNLYGAWNVNSNLANTFRQRNFSNSNKIANRIMALLPLAYIFTFGDRFLGGYINGMLASQEYIAEAVWIMVEVVFLALLLTYLGLFKSITNGVQLIRAANAESSEDESVESEGA